jgi:oxalate decarboxylase/phosphoglucose isomerase-like protein (cupin superfamily)
MNAARPGGYSHRVHNVGAETFEVLDYLIVAASRAFVCVFRGFRARRLMQLKMTAPNGQTMSHAVKAGDVHWVDTTVPHALANESNAGGEIIELDLK